MTKIFPTKTICIIVHSSNDNETDHFLDLLL